MGKAYHAEIILNQKQYLRTVEKVKGQKKHYIERKFEPVLYHMKHSTLWIYHIIITSLTINFEHDTFAGILFWYEIICMSYHGGILMKRKNFRLKDAYNTFWLSYL